MAVQRNPIAGTPNPTTSTVNSLQKNGFRIATSSKEQIQDGLDWWAGETGGTQVIIYSTKNAQSEAYPSGSGDYTPVAWGSFGSVTDAKVIELINGLPGRPANTQYTTLGDAVTWLHDSNEYFVMNQDYPFIKTIDPAIIWDPSVPQCSVFGAWNNEKKTQNLGNPLYIDNTQTPSTFQPQNPNETDFYPNGGTAYGTFKTVNRTAGGVMLANSPMQLSGLTNYSTDEGWVANVAFKHSQISHGSAPIFALGDPDTNGFVLYLRQPNSGQPANGIEFGTFGSMNNIPYAFTANQWYFLSVVYDQPDGEYRIYLDGSSIGTGNDNGYNWTENHLLQIGGQTESTATEYSSGYLEIGSFVLDTGSAETHILYNYKALFDHGKINPKY